MYQNTVKVMQSPQQAAPPPTAEPQPFRVNTLLAYSALHLELELAICEGGMVHMLALRYKQRWFDSSNLMHAQEWWPCCMHYVVMCSQQHTPCRYLMSSKLHTSTASTQIPDQSAVQLQAWSSLSLKLHLMAEVGVRKSSRYCFFTWKLLKYNGNTQA